MRALTLTHARRRAVFGASTFGLPSRFLAEIPPDLVDRQGSATTWGAAAVTSGAPRPSPTSWSSGGSATAVATAFHLGDDVIHAAFGEGVVIGLEAGGVIIVRFAGDGSERKLMAEYAPIEKRRE
jgi:DNA helicase-2/ATP-dependent DNA helicase PcrA